MRMFQCAKNSYTENAHIGAFLYAVGMPRIEKYMEFWDRSNAVHDRGTKFGTV
jgi:hypothetical protein